MNDTRELIDAVQFGWLLAAVSGLALLAVGVLAWRSRGTARPNGIRGLVLASGAALLFPLWLVYNQIENWLGLDSVAALVLNLVLFIAVGCGAGLLVRRFWPVEESATGGK